jgi:ABC-type lipoprotein release transport system permease subunit
MEEFAINLIISHIIISVIFACALCSIATFLPSSVLRIKKELEVPAIFMPGGHGEGPT